MEKHEIYKCDECKQVVEVTVGGDKPIFCCGKEMQKLIPQTAEYKLEKHVPYPEATPNGMRVLVGKEMAHPMTEAHQRSIREPQVSEARREARSRVLCSDPDGNDHS